MVSKIVKVLMVLMIVLSTFIPNLAYADENATQTNEKSRQMLDFFRDDRSLDVENTTQDEMKVYGVFLSNFMTPFSTKLGDIDGDAIAKTVSKKFFGNEEQANTVKEINAKIELAIKDGIKNSTGEYSLHYSKGQARDGTVMTGNQLLNIIAGTKENRYIYNSKEVTVMDLDSKGTHGAWKVLFGIYPREFVGGERVLRSIKGLYLDGLGNIWGAKDLNAPQEEYILIFPAVLNPVTFTGKIDGGIPLNNVFSMGAMLQINSSNVLSSKKLVAYYNVPKLFGGSNMTSIYGIETNNPIWGRLHSYMKGTLTEKYTYSKAVAFSKKSTSDGVDLSTTKLLITTNFEADNKIIETDLKGLSDSDIFKDGSDDEKKKYKNRKEVASGFVGYMGKTISYNLDKEVIDSMYFFSTNKGDKSQAGGESTYGTWSDLDSIMESSLYYYKDGAETKFHKNSAYMSKLGLLVEETANKGYDSVVKTVQSRMSELKNGTTTGTDGADIGLQILSHVLSDGQGEMNGKLSSGTTHLNSWREGIKRFYEYGYGYGFTEGVAITNKTLTDKGFIFGIGSSSATSYAGATEDDLKYLHYTPENYVDVDVYKEAKKYAPQQIFAVNLYRVFTGHSAWANLINDGTSAGAKVGQNANGGEMVARTKIANGANHYPGIYWAYMVDILKVKSVNGKLTSSTWSNTILPSMSIAVNGTAWDINSILESGGVLSTEEKTLEEQQKDIIRKTTALLSTEFDEVRNQILRSTQNGFLIETHRSIIGSNMGSAFNVGANSTKAYATTVGYINTPKLTDLPLIEWFIKDYMYVFVLIMTIVLMVLVMLMFLRIRSIKQSLVIFAVMCFVMYLPQFVLGNSVAFTNSITDKIYSERFNYWALIQHEYRVQNSAEEISGDNELEYILISNLQKADDMYSDDSGVRVKWMAPKKDDVFDQLFSDGRIDESLQANLTIFKWLFSSYFYEETLSGDRLDTFLYRPYNAIANSARANYDKYNASTKPSKGDYNSVISSYKSNITSLPTYRFALASDSNRKITYSAKVKEMINKSSTYISNLSLKEAQTSYRYWGLTDTKVTHAIFRDNYTNTSAGVEQGTTKEYEAFLLNSESPYYYFYNVIKANYTVDGSGFKDSLLREEFFRVKNVDPKVNGKTRDFLDVEGLFTYVIPYLHQGNEYVNGWGKKYGLDVPTFDFNASDVVVTNGSDVEITKKFNEAKQKKENLRNVWRLYSPWVAQLYNTENMKNKVKVAGKNKIVADALNPGAYQDIGRDMIFSEADMVAKSYGVDSLSQTEIKIQRFLEDTYTDFMYLVNYRDLSDEVLISMAAMTATFNFNQEFSDYNMFSESSELYPQAFELTNFNYDAFLRLMLLNTTGEPIYIEGDDDLYVRVLNKTSWFTGIVLIVKDITAVYLIPMARIIVVMMIFFLSLLYSFSLILSQPKDIVKKTFTIIGVPLLTYIGATLGFAFVMSMFVGDGYDSYVGSQTASFELNDPTITLIFATLVDLIFVYILFILIKKLWESLKQYGGGSISHVAGLVGSTVSMATKGVKNSIKTGADVLGGTVKAPAKIYKANKKRVNYNREMDSRADMMSNIGRIADNTDVTAGRLSLDEINNMAGSRREDKAKEVATAGGKKATIKVPFVNKLKGKAKETKATTEGTTPAKENPQTYATKVKKQNNNERKKRARRKKKYGR